MDYQIPDLQKLKGIFARPSLPHTTEEMLTEVMRRFCAFPEMVREDIEHFISEYERITHAMDEIADAKDHENGLDPDEQGNHGKAKPF